MIYEKFFLTESSTKINRPFKNSKYLKNCDLTIDSSVLKINPTISTDSNLLKQIDSIYNTKVHKALMNYIKISYPDWYAGSKISLNQVYAMALKLLNSVSVDYLSKNTYVVSYWISPSYNDPLYDKFFGGHCIYCEVMIDATTYKLQHVNEPDMIG